MPEYFKVIKMSRFDLILQRYKKRVYKEGYDIAFALAMEYAFNDAFEESMNKGREEGEKNGRKKMISEIVQAMRKNELSDEIIAKLTQLPLDVIRKTETQAF